MALTVRTPRVSQSGVPIYIDVSELRALARDLNRASREAGKALRKGMLEAGELVAADAKSRADYSKRIPGSIHVTAGRTNFRVRAGGESAPNASPVENKGKGFIRHPVFLTYDQAHSGSSKYIKRWTEKNSRPAFLAPALDANAEKVAEIVGNTVHAAVKSAVEGR